MGLFGRKVICAKCGGKVNAKKEAFQCTACGQTSCWACVANAYVAQHGWPSVPGDNRSAVMSTIMAMADRGEAPCALCSQAAGKRWGHALAVRGVGPPVSAGLRDLLCTVKLDGNALASTVGLETVGQTVTPVIEAGTGVPCERTMMFTTAQDAQSEVEIHVVQGDGTSIAHPDMGSLGKYSLVGIPPMPRGVPQIEVTFAVGADGRFFVRARDKATGREAKVLAKATSPPEAQKETPAAAGTLHRELLAKASEEVKKLAHMLPMIAELGSDPSKDALGKLLGILQFDVHGEIVIHCSLAVAGRPDKEAVKTAIQCAFEKAPATSAPWGLSNVVLVSSAGVFAGDTGGTGTGVFPRMRLLYPLAWMREADFIRTLLDKSDDWPGASKGKKACYELIPAIASGIAAIAEKIAYFEYLDDAGNRSVMEQTCSLYPHIGLTSAMWQCVRHA